MNTVITTYTRQTTKTLKLALPIIAGQLGQVLMGFFDTVQIGELGHDYIAGSGFGNNLYWITTLLGMGVLFAVSTLASEAFGEQNEWKAIGIYRSGVKVAIALTLIFMVVMALLIQYIEVFQETPIVNQIAVRFLRIIVFSTLFMFLFTAAKQLLDGMGRTWIGMAVTIGGLGLNVLLNYLLIGGRWGFPRLEIEGAAIATSVSRVLMTFVLLVVIWRDKKIQALRKQFFSQVVQKSYVWPIVKIGVPSGFQFFFEVAAFGAAQIMSGWIDGENINQAAYQIAINLASITFMFVTGFSVAANILTGYEYGARNTRGIKVAGNTVFMLTVLVEIFFAILFLVFHTQLPLLYNSEPTVVAIASAMLIFAAFFQLSDGLQSVAAGALRGIQDVKLPSLIAFISYWLVMVPACYVLTFTLNMGQKGIWIGFIIGLSTAAALLLVRFYWKSRRIVFQQV